MYQTVSSKIATLVRSYQSISLPWKNNIMMELDDLVRNHLPCGSGFDTSPELDTEKSTTNQLIFYSDYHVMDDNGTYAGYANFMITVDGDLTDINVSCLITNSEDFEIDPDDYPDENPEDLWSLDVDGLEEYIADMYYEALSQSI